MQVYVDNTLEKSIQEDDHLDDLKETFDTLCSYNIKLNPSKCAFGVTAGKFLGFMESQKGIKVNLDKVRAIMELMSSKNIKEVLRFSSNVVALNRFISRAMDKCLPFFRTLKKSFEWTVKCQQAFEDLKVYLSSPPLLSPSKPGRRIVSLFGCLPCIC